MSYLVLTIRFSFHFLLIFISSSSYLIGVESSIARNVEKVAIFSAKEIILWTIIFLRVTLFLSRNLERSVICRNSLCSIQVLLDVFLPPIAFK